MKHKRSARIDLDEKFMTCGRNIVDIAVRVRNLSDETAVACSYNLLTRVFNAQEVRRSIEFTL